MAKGEATGISGLLIVGQPMLLTKELAVKVGVNPAIFLQQVHFMVTRYGKEVDGEKWLKWSAEKWEKRVFPFWSESTLHRIIGNAEEQGWLRVRRSPGATALFSIDYDVLASEFKGDRGVKLTPHGGVKMTHPQGCQNDTPQGCQNDTPVPHIERDTTREKNQEASPTARATRRCAQDLLDGKRLEKKQMENREKAERKLERHQTVMAVEDYWRILLPESGYKRMALSFTAAERGMIRLLISKFTNGDEKKLKSFLEFCVRRWKQLRPKITWEPGGKRSKLAEIPNFKEIYYSKEELFHYFENEKEVTPHRESAKVYTHIDQVPKNHPQYALLKSVIKHSGKAVVQQ